MTHCHFVLFEGEYVSLEGLASEVSQLFIGKRM